MKDVKYLKVCLRTSADGSQWPQLYGSLQYCLCINTVIIINFLKSLATLSSILTEVLDSGMASVLHITYKVKSCTDI